MPRPPALTSEMTRRGSWTSGVEPIANGTAMPIAASRRSSRWTSAAVMFAAKSSSSGWIGATPAASAAAASVHEA